MRLPLYLDYNATTPVDPGVAAEMLPYPGAHFGNASSTHDYGLAAQAGMVLGRSRLAALLGCAPADLVFTGAGSEANNLALKGAVFAAMAAGRGPGHVRPAPSSRWRPSAACAGRRACLSTPTPPSPWAR